MNPAQILLTSLVVGITSLSLSTTLRGENGVGDWPQFRGPNGNGFSIQDHPLRWDATNNVAWSVPIAGGGWSSPVTIGNRVFLTTAVSSNDLRPKGWGEGVSSMRSFYSSKPPSEPLSFEVHCLSLADGQPLWEKRVVSRKPAHKIHPSNSYATESPVTDGKNVYAYFASVGVVARLDINGELAWQRELGTYQTSNDFGTGSSLAILGDKLFVQCDNEEKSFVVALDCLTGEDVWRVPRTSRTSWSSPVVWNNRFRSELVVCGSGMVTAYDPETGNVLWNLTASGGAYSASPTFDDDRIYFGNSGRNSRGPLVAVNAGAKGELTLDTINDDGLAWLQEASAPAMCSPVVAAGRLYVLSRGVLSCHDVETGERLYRQRMKNGSGVTSSLWAADDQVFALSESGETTVIKAGDRFEQLATNQSDGLFWSTPSVAGESLLLRGATKLICIRK
ncbi:MAG: PQQ-binding-like beta-propeller repeat protein [Planctomycetota bacterium]